MIGLLTVATAISVAAPQIQDSLQAEFHSDTTATAITLEQALEIALSENVSVKVADKEIERTGYARKGSYASLFPTLDGSAAYQRTIKKQVMYMDFDMGSLGGLPGADEDQGDDDHHHSEAQDTVLDVGVRHGFTSSFRRR